GPVIGIVMLVHPQQHIDIARVGLQHDAAVILIDAHRAKMAVTGVVDLLVIDAGGLRVATELADELHHLLLLAAGNGGKRLQEAVAYSDFCLHCHYSSLKQASTAASHSGDWHEMHSQPGIAGSPSGATSKTATLMAGQLSSGVPTVSSSIWISRPTSGIGRFNARNCSTWMAAMKDSAMTTSHPSTGSVPPPAGAPLWGQPNSTMS